LSIHGQKATKKCINHIY